VPSLIDAGAEVHLLAPAALSGDASQLGRELVHFDSVVHLGYRRPETGGYWSQVGEEVLHNLAGTARLLEAAAAAHIEQICFASSVAVYTPPAHGVAEHGAVGGDVTPYALVKLQQEDFMRRWAVLTKRPVTVMRLATVYGPGETVSRAVPNFIRTLMAGRAPRVDGRGCNPFDLVYVDDVAGAFRRALELRADGVFNIGTGVGRTATEIAANLIRLVGVDYDVEENLEADERGGVVCDVSLADRALGFRAAMPLEDGLRAEVEWYRSLPVAMRA